MNKIRTEHIGVFLLTFTTLVITYLPSLLFSYAHHDDFRFWEHIPQHSIFHSYFIENVVYGRLISSYLLTIAGWFVNSVGDLNIIRLVSILQLSICAMICIYALKRYFNGSLSNAYCAAVMIFTLPPFQVMVSYAAYFFLPFTLLLASFAARLSSQSVSPEKTLWQQAVSAPLLLAIALLFCALATYAAGAIFYWFVSACYILSSAKEPQNEKRMIGQIFYAGLVSLLLYGLYLHGIKQHFSAYTSGIYDPYNITAAYGEKLKWFINEPLQNSFNLWNIFPAKYSAMPAVFFVLSAGILFLLKGIFQKQKVMNKLLFYLSLFLALTILSFLPNLLAQGNAAFYRCCSGLTALFVLIMIWAFTEWLAFFPARLRSVLLTTILLSGTVYGIYQAQSTVLNSRIIPSTIELNYVENILRETDLRQIEHIHLILPTDRSKSRYDEFGAPGMVFAQDFRGIILCALKQTGKERQFNSHSISISVSYRERHLQDFQKPAIIIDVRELYRYES